MIDFKIVSLDKFFLSLVGFDTEIFVLKIFANPFGINLGTILLEIRVDMMSLEYAMSPLRLVRSCS